MTFQAAAPAEGNAPDAVAVVSHATRIGELSLAVGRAGLLACSFQPPARLRQRWAAAAHAHPPPGGLVDRVRSEVDAYLEGRLREFTVPVDLGGVPGFGRRVLLALRHVGYGETVTYAGLARRLQLPATAARAVGSAVAANPVLLVVPCHRVVGSDGALVGYAGGLHAKRLLLGLEAGQASLAW